MGWTLGALARRPASWITGAGLLLVWPAWMVLAPIGIALRDGHEIRAIYEFAFVGTVVGGILGVGALGRGAWVISHLPRGPRYVAESAVLFCATLAGGALVLAPTLVSGAAPLPRAALGALVTTAAHVAALALLASRLTPSHGLRLVLLVSVSWLLPGLLEGARPWGPAFGSLVDASAALAWDAARLETPGLVWGDVTAAMAAALAAWLLDPPSISRR